jgi:hypothetical protein
VLLRWLGSSGLSVASAKFFARKEQAGTDLSESGRGIGNQSIGFKDRQRHHLLWFEAKAL